MSRPKYPPYENTPRHAITEWLPKTLENVDWCAKEVARISQNDVSHIYSLIFSETNTHLCIVKLKRKTPMHKPLGSMRNAISVGKQHEAGKETR